MILFKSTVNFYIGSKFSDGIGKAIDHKSSGADLRAYMLEVLPDYDQERVYDSDLKKLFSWYNLLQDKDFINAEAFAEVEASETEETPESDSSVQE